MHRLVFTLLAVSLLSLPSSSASDDYASQVMNATFKLFHPASTSTCFIVSHPPSDPNLYLVTAAHSLERTKGDTAVLVLRKAEPDGSYQRLDHTIAIRNEDHPLWTRSPTLDVAVLPLTVPLPVEITPLPAKTLATENQLKTAQLHIGSPLLVLTYPQRFEANGAGFPVARNGIFASPPLLPVKTHPTFLADYTTFAGDSGGPVFVPGPQGHPLIVGLVLAQSHHEDRVKSEYQERTIRHPLGIGTVLHAHYIKQTLTKAASGKKDKGDSG